MEEGGRRQLFYIEKRSVPQKGENTHARTQRIRGKHGSTMRS